MIFTRCNPSEDNMKNKINNYFDNGGGPIIIKTKKDYNSFIKQPEKIIEKKKRKIVKNQRN